MPERPYRPPGTTTRVQAQRVLVLAPHYDDEVLGCGGLLAQLAREATVRVLFLTDASGGGIEPAEDPAAYSATRKREAQAAARVLGLTELGHLGFADGRLVDQLGPVADALRETLLDFAPDLLLVPSPLEVTEDHRAAFAAVHRVLGGARDGGRIMAELATLRVLAYEVNHPLYPHLLVDVGAETALVEQAIDCYTSQLAKHPYKEACLGLQRYRAHSLPPTVEAAEAYAQLTLDDFRTRSLAGVIGFLGGAPQVLTVDEGPMMSVIVRTRDRPELLAEALASLAASTYRKAEVIVVNDGGQEPELPTAYPLTLRRVDLADNQGRAAAANAGVAEAQGDGVAFLDDDDLAEPEHLETLAGLLGAAGVRAAYTDAAVGVYQLEEAGGWVCQERRLPYSRDFDPELLLYDNYIPFNTLVLDRSLFGQIGPFDEDLPFFEDWDWLIRCSARTRLHHLPRVTCEYRQFRGSGHHVLGDEPRKRADFLAMKARVIAKHGSRTNPATAARVVDRLRAETVVALDEQRRLGTAVADADDRYHRLNGALADQQAELRAVNAERAALEGRASASEAQVLSLKQAQQTQDAELKRLYAREQEQEDSLKATYAEIERLGRLIETMESTRAWRLHQSWQRLSKR